MIICQFENGGKAKLRHVTTGAIVTNNKNQVLLVRRSPDQLNPNRYTLPGGFLNRDEDSREGSIREIFEETGLHCRILYLFHIVDTPRRPKEDRQNVEFRYVAEVISGKERTSNETSELKWVSGNSIPEDEEFAFDHRKTVMKYFEHLEKPLTLPILN